MTSADIAGAMRTWRPRVWFVRARWWLNQIPTSLFLLALRIGVALVFFTSGRIKLITWDFTIRLFTEEFKLPVIPPEVGATLAAFVELTFPPFLIIGLAARLATLPLLGMLAVIQILVYPELLAGHAAVGRRAAPHPVARPRRNLDRPPDRAHHRHRFASGSASSSSACSSPLARPPRGISPTTTWPMRRCPACSSPARSAAVSRV